MSLVEVAQKVTVVLEDDLTGGPAEQTARFAFEGTDYEIDLNATNAAAFGKQLAAYLEHARRARTPRSGRDRRKRTRTTGTSLAVDFTRRGAVRKKTREPRVPRRTAYPVVGGRTDHPHLRVSRSRTSYLSGRADRRLSEAVPVYAAPDQDVCGVNM
jgi:Lsr2